MSDYDFRSTATNPNRAAYQGSGSSSGLWLIAAGVVVLLVLGLAFIGGGSAPVDGQLEEGAAPTAVETAPVPATE